MVLLCFAVCSHFIVLRSKPSARIQLLLVVLVHILCMLIAALCQALRMLYSARAPIRTVVPVRGAFCIQSAASFHILSTGDAHWLAVAQCTDGGHRCNKRWGKVLTTLKRVFMPKNILKDVCRRQIKAWPSFYSMRSLNPWFQDVVFFSYCEIFWKHNLCGKIVIRNPLSFCQ